MDKKTKLTILFSALAGSFVGALIVFVVASSYFTQFFTDTTARSSAANLKMTIKALESLRVGDSRKAIETLEFEAKTGLVSFGALDVEEHPRAKKAILNSISDAKQYSNRYPLKPDNEQEQVLIDKALNKVE